ncbi:MAG: signal peptidase II [Rhizobiaceae bacterium]
MRKLGPYLLLVLAAVALDQWIKHLVQTRMEMFEKIDILPFLALFRTYNTGVAFSMLSFVDGWGLMAISAVIIVFVLYLAVRTEPGHVFARTGFALIVGGAAGNLIDRALLDHVVDYVLFHTPVWSFAVFNLADAFITVGAGLVILQELLNWHAERKVKS